MVSNCGGWFAVEVGCSGGDGMMGKLWVMVGCGGGMGFVFVF